MCDRLDRNAQEERAQAIFKAIIDELKDLKDKKINKEELDTVKEAMQLAVRYDVQEFNDKKRDRYVKIIGSALRSDKQIDDLASFIQDVEQLGERDFIALKVLNRVMNQPRLEGRDIHPNEFTNRRQELGLQMAEAFGDEHVAPNFSREQGYDACNRLPGSTRNVHQSRRFKRGRNVSSLPERPAPNVGCRRYQVRASRQKAGSVSWHLPQATPSSAGGVAQAVSTEATKPRC